ncbi:4-oxalocrotonate tautomerase family protein [Pseudomonas sp. MWU12-2534b]|nr:4-oxalocrotonate tautomerase family protein [Pseudomonas sp. MWU12-2534b]
MPYINVRLLDDLITIEQKTEIIRRFTETMVEVLNKEPEHTFVVIDEVSKDNWGVAGMTVAQRRSNRLKE